MEVNYRHLMVWSLLAVLVSPLHAIAETAAHTMICGAKAGWTGATGEGDPAPEAVALIGRITGMVGIQPNFKIRAADFSHGGTAFAATRNGQRYIVYDRAKFNWAEGRASYAHLGIMAHEIGHHLAAHVFTSESSSHARELEADQYAGFAMALLGAGIMEAQHMFRKDWPASLSHPASPERRAAVRAGWLAGKGEVLRHQRKCRLDLLSSDLEVENRTCRVVGTCESDTPAVRLACRDREGSWVYGDPGGVQ